MKKYPGILLPFFFAMTMCQLISCKKPFDKIIQQMPEDIRICNIKSMTTGYGNANEIRWTFTYNDHGDPLSVVRDRSGTGQPDFLFRYDKQHHLTDWIGVYRPAENPDFYEFWERYTYDSQKRIVKADRYIFGNYGKDPDPNSYTKSEVFFQYDMYGRVVGVSNKPGYFPDNTYNYDVKGNKIFPATYPWAKDYDDYLNLHCTNKIWQFIDKDYSVHNPAPAKAYNRLGLPLQINYPVTLYFLGYTFNAANIEYYCDAGGGARLE